jgi:hypothetical protein
MGDTPYEGQRPPMPERTRPATYLSRQQRADEPDHEHAADRIVTVYPPGGHGFPLDAREAAYRFIDGVLKTTAATR